MCIRDRVSADRSQLMKKTSTSSVFRNGDSFAYGFYRTYAVGANMSFFPYSSTSPTGSRNHLAWFCCKESGYFTKPVKNITNGIFICHKQVNNDTKSNSYSLKRQ